MWSKIIDRCNRKSSSVGCLIHMLLKVTDARSGHRGQATKGYNINPTILASCDTRFIANFAFQIQWCGLDDHWGRLSSVSFFSLFGGKSHLMGKIFSSLKYEWPTLLHLWKEFHVFPTASSLVTWQLMHPHPFVPHPVKILTWNPGLSVSIKIGITPFYKNTAVIFLLFFSS